MVADAHGRRESLSELRKRFPTSLAGASLKSIIAIADTLGFSSRAVRCEIEYLDRLQLPAILHWELDHFVVLRRIGRRAAWISDPARGDRKVPLDQLSKAFTGVALELTPAEGFRRKKRVDPVRLSDLWSRFSGLRLLLVQLFVLTLLLQSVSLLTPLASQLVVDDVIGRGDRDLLTAILVGFAGLIVVQSAVELVRGFVQLHASQSLSIQLSGNLLKHMLRLPTSFFERRHVGDVMSRFSSLLPVQSFLTSGLVGVVLDALLVVPVVVIMVMYSPVLAGVAAVNLVVVLVVRALSFSTTRRLAEDNINQIARSDSVFLETVRGARAIKIAGREAERHGVWQNAVIDQQNASFQEQRFRLWGVAGLASWQGFHGLLMLFVGAHQVMDGNMTLGMFFAFQSYSAQFAGRVGGLINAFFTFRMLGLHLERLSDIIHSEPEAGLDGPAVLSRTLSGDIEVRNLKFRYSPNEPWVLDNVSFSVPAGQTLAIVGPSGGGKSTLLKLLIGIYEPEDGVVLVDGHPMKSLGLRAVRDRFGVVMQDDQLLSGTITDNVSFFDPHVDAQRVERACRAAHVHDEILRMPMGYHSLVGDMGSVFSGGQKQRILLARALYKEPTVLFMDEGTANLDGELELKVMASLSALRITRVMVAHRDAAIRGADRILHVSRNGVELEIVDPTVDRGSPIRSGGIDP